MTDIQQNNTSSTNPNWFSRVFFIGIGGKGMSALARYYVTRGFLVAGYDSTASTTTQQLENIGCSISYQDDAQLVPEPFLDQKQTLVVRTPAVPETNALCQFFMHSGFCVQKRSEVLGSITKLRHMHALCVAGTLGKIHTTTMLAHLLYQSEIGTNAFLGRISKNYGSNLLLQPESNLVVIQADEYDSSFLSLSPMMAIITSTNPQHLEIYGSAEAFHESYSQFTSLVEKGGLLLLHQGEHLEARLQPGVKMLTYGIAPAADTPSEMPLPDYYADHIEDTPEGVFFDFHAPQMAIEHLKLGLADASLIPHAVAAIAIAWLNGVSPTEIRIGVQSYRGVEPK